MVAFSLSLRCDPNDAGAYILSPQFITSNLKSNKCNQCNFAFTCANDIKKRMKSDDESDITNKRCTMQKITNIIECLAETHIPSPLWSLSSATCRRCKVWNDIESLSSLTQMLHFMCGHNLWHLPPPLTMIRVPALWLMQVSYLQRKKVDGAKFKVTQSVRGGLAGGRHKMWRQKPEEPSSRGAPTQLFLTLEHWI